MKDYLLKLAIEWLLKNLTKENVEKWAEMVKNYLLPKLRMSKNELIKRLRDEAAKSPSSLDDHAVTLLDTFLEALLPDNPTHL